MKVLYFILLLLYPYCGVYAQNQDTKQQIRTLEQEELLATLKKDTATLRNLWSEDLTVNSPFNRVVHGGRNTLDRPVITQLSYVSFERNVEDILLKHDLAISMGNEVVVEKGSNGSPDRTINRRYTNIWQNQNGQWKLIARHANIVCASQ